MKHHISPPEPIVARVHMDATLVDNNECDSADQFISLTPEESKTWHQFGCCSYCLTMCCGTFLCPSSFLLPPSFPRLSLLTVLCVLKMLQILFCPLLHHNTHYKIGTNKLLGQLAVKDSRSITLFFPSSMCVCVCEHSLEEEWL